MPQAAPFVTNIDLSLVDKMRKDLLEQGFTFSTPPYTIFSAQKKGVSCNLYTSGKLVVQGKEKEAFITFYLEPEILGKLHFSYPETQEKPEVDLRPHAGVDESGKGDFFGPLCIAAVFATKEMIQELIKLGAVDSKKMLDPKILRLSKEIQKICPSSIVRIFPEKYNELYTQFRNLNALLAWGHATVIADIAQKTGCHDVIIDQFANERVVEQALKKKGVTINLTQRFRGEEDAVVAAASILARAAFVEGIRQLSERVGIELPKGASKQVIDAGKKLVARDGQESLKSVAKLHFKTVDQVIDVNSADTQ